MPLLLAVDTSAKPVSCALMRDDRLLACYYANTGATHSQTLMSMIDSVLHTAGVSVQDLDAVAVNAGPGSFTGVRIGVSAVKGIAFTHDLPCVSVSTLAAMACSVPLVADAVVCCVMDARCQQVYAALFTADASGCVQRLTEDEAISLDELHQRLEVLDKPVILVGDGSEISYAHCGDIPRVSLAPAAVRFQSAAGTAQVAMAMLAAGDVVSAERLLPLYLRLPQAERELRQRLAAER